MQVDPGGPYGAHQKSDNTSVMRALEFGANGIMVPHCRSAEEASQWVEWAKFPPEGKRGYDCARADANFALSDSLEFLEERNQETFLVFQIEDREAVDCVEEIATTDGVDGLFIGPGDLTISHGIPFKRKDPLSASNG